MGKIDEGKLIAARAEIEALISEREGMLAENSARGRKG